jgi:BMFP domain-containing protein YqiC
MSKSRFVLDKFAKLIEQGLLSYKDLSEEIMNILKSKRDEIVFRMKLTSKEEFDILNKRVSNLEKKLNEIKKNKSSKKTKRAKKS